jgi:hypothetical protein
MVKQPSFATKRTATVFVAVKKESRKTVQRGIGEKTIRSQVENIWAETLKRRVKLFRITRTAIMEM